MRKNICFQPARVTVRSVRTTRLGLWRPVQVTGAQTRSCGNPPTHSATVSISSFPQNLVTCCTVKNVKHWCSLNQNGWRKKFLRSLNLSSQSQECKTPFPGCPDNCQSCSYVSENRVCDPGYCDDRFTWNPDDFTCHGAYPRVECGFMASGTVLVVTEPWCSFQFFLFQTRAMTPCPVLWVPEP